MDKKFEVTLAKPKAEKIDFTKEIYFIQPKLDGVRCYTRLVDGEVKMFSRNHKEFKNARHLTTSLKRVFELYPDIVLDGELYNHKFSDNFNKIISLVRKQKPTQGDRFESATHLEYHLYDVYDPNNSEDVYASRYSFLSSLKRYANTGNKIKVVETIEINSGSKLKLWHDLNKAEGYEGSMVRKNVPYDQRRSDSLQKVKDWMDTEMIVTGFVEGKGKFKGGLGKFIGVDSEGRVVEVPWPSLTIKDRYNIWRFRTDYIGKELTFEYFERTPSGAYRFPRAKAFRNYE